MPKRKWLVVLEATTYARYMGSSNWESACVQQGAKFHVKLHLHKIFLYVFCLRKYFYNEKKKATYSIFSMQSVAVTFRTYRMT